MSEKTIKEAIEDVKVMICNYVSSVGGREDFKKNDFGIIKAMLSDFERLSKESCIEDVAISLYREYYEESIASWENQTPSIQEQYRKQARAILLKETK